MEEMDLLLRRREIIEGVLICPKCNRKYPIEEGIVNMLLNSNEL